MRVSVVVVAAVCFAFSGCRGCDGVEPLPPLPPDQVDVFTQVSQAKVDILWVIDNSGSMAAEQEKLADRFESFFDALVVAGVDYHIGVVTTDRSEGGVLREFGGVVDGCDRCAVLDNDVAEDDAAVVFADLVTAGASGAAFEEGFASALAALEDGNNDGFVRDDAALYVVFVSDEDESGGDGLAAPRHLQRALESLKPRGQENTVAVAAIAGYPLENAPVPIESLCDVLGTTFNANVGDDDPRAAALQETLRDGPSCVDPALPDDVPAAVGGRYFELACRTGGVVANLCAGDYGTALDGLGANAAGLRRTFPLSAADRAGGDDCAFAFDDSDAALDCDGNGDFDDAVDGPVCVVAQCTGDDAPQAQPRGTVWQWEPSTSSVRFDAGCVPAPGTEVTVRYALLPGGSTCPSP